ncbi:MAG: hypothetical protein NXI31_26730 [bacterium]|nr:hypothetical protein [bacterium]
MTSSNPSSDPDSTPGSVPANSSPATSTASSDLRRVRDILFGESERRTTSQLGDLEQRLQAQAKGLAELSSQLREQRVEFEQRLGAAVADVTAVTEREREALRAELQQHISDLREQKLDRDALAALLGGIADQLGRPAKDPS